MGQGYPDRQHHDELTRRLDRSPAVFALMRDDFADQAGIERCVEQAAVRPSADAARAGVRRRDWIFANNPTIRFHAPDFVGGIGGKPEVPVRRDADTPQ